MALMVAAAVASPVLAQSQPEQVVATIPVDGGNVTVANGPKDQVLLTVEGTKVSMQAEHALQIANWIKEGRSAKDYHVKPVKLRRSGQGIELTILPENGKAKTAQLQSDPAFQLAAALAASRQNVTQAKTKR